MIYDTLAKDNLGGDNQETCSNRSAYVPFILSPGFNRSISQNKAVASILRLVKPNSQTGWIIGTNRSLDNRK